MHLVVKHVLQTFVQMEEKLLFVCFTIALQYERFTQRSNDRQSGWWMASPKNKPKHFVLSVSFTLYSKHKQLERYVNKMGITVSPVCISFLLFGDDTSANIIISDADGVAASLDVSPADCWVSPRLSLVFQP